MSESTLKRTGSYVTDNVTNCVHVCAFIILSLCFSLALYFLSPPMHCTMNMYIVCANALCSMQQAFALLHMLQIMSNSNSFVKWRAPQTKQLPSIYLSGLKINFVHSTISNKFEYTIALQCDECAMCIVSVFLCFSINWMRAYAYFHVHFVSFRFVWSQLFSIWMFLFIKFVKNSFKSHTVQLAPLICPTQLTCRTQTGQHL